MSCREDMSSVILAVQDMARTKGLAALLVGLPTLHAQSPGCTLQGLRRGGARENTLEAVQGLLLALR